MALTLTDPATGPRTELVGRQRHVSKLVAFDSSLGSGATIGESLTPADFGLTRIDRVVAENRNGYTFEYDVTSQLLVPIAGVAVLTETLLKSAFTDGGGTSGFKDFAGTIPLGSQILGWRGVTTTAWTGDTSAVLQLGVSGDVDRFTADTTYSVFATGVDGSTAIAADAGDGIAAAVTPRATVTSGADFTNVASGATTVVSMLYIPPSLPGADLSGLTGVRVTAIGV